MLVTMVSTIIELDRERLDRPLREPGLPPRWWRWLGLALTVIVSGAVLAADRRRETFWTQDPVSGSPLRGWEPQLVDMARTDSVGVSVAMIGRFGELRRSC